jgi:hypothetical protein
MAETPKQQADQPVRFTLTHYRKAGTAHDAFMKWIVEVHLPKAIPVFQKHGVIGYALVSLPVTLPRRLLPKMPPMRPSY